MPCILVRDSQGIFLNLRWQKEADTDKNIENNIDEKTKSIFAVCFRDHNSFTMQETELCLLVWLSSHAFRLRSLGSAMALIWRILLKATFLGHESLNQQNAMCIGW